MDGDVVVRREERGLISVLTMEYRPSTKPWRAPSPRKAWLDLEVVQCGIARPARSWQSARINNLAARTRRLVSGIRRAGR
jgi:hypothetical protein